MLLTVLVLLSLLGSGLMAGLFFAFSVAVLPALGSEPAPGGMSAMQRINVVIVRPVFLAVFVGTAITALAAVAVTVVDGSSPSRPLVVAGTTAYALASIALTGGYHVPRNDRLAAADPATADGVATWETYRREWTRWNHVRVLGCLLATACFAVALAVS